MICKRAGLPLYSLKSVKYLTCIIALNKNMIAIGFYSIICYVTARERNAKIKTSVLYETK